EQAERAGASTWRGLASDARSELGLGVAAATALWPKKSGRHPSGSPGCACSQTWRMAAARLAAPAIAATAHPLTLSHRLGDTKDTARKSAAPNTLQRWMRQSSHGT